MIDDMGIFRTTIEVANVATDARRRVLRDVMVDAGSEYNWIPTDVLIDVGVAPIRIERFKTANGAVIERPIGFAMLHAGTRYAPCIVVFAEPNAMILLGAIGLESMNLRVDLV